jgi:hypothetical protein
MRNIPINVFSAKLSASTSTALPLFQAFTDCETVATLPGMRGEDSLVSITERQPVIRKCCAQPVSAYANL